MTKKSNGKTAPKQAVELDEATLARVTGGNAQYNPKELPITTPVPWKRTG